MISPHTLPGTDVVCVNAAPSSYGGPPILELGAVYTVDTIEISLNGFYVATLSNVTPVIIFDIKWGLVSIAYGLDRFNYLSIPKCLTELLTNIDKPIDGDEIEKPCTLPKKVKRKIHSSLSLRELAARSPRNLRYYGNPLGD